LELDPDEPVALAVQATTLFFADREYQAGLDAFHDLLARFPNNIDMLYFAWEAFKTIGRSDLALRLGERAVELDPLSWLVLGTHGIALLSNGRFAEAEAFFLRGRKIDGRLWPQAAYAAFFQGDLEKAERYMETFLADWDQEQQPGVWSNLEVAMNFAYTIGETERAKRLAQSLLDLAETKHVPDNAKSNAYYVLGDESWVTALGQALANPSYLLLSQLRVPPAFHEPEYQELLKTVGLDDQSVAKLHVQDLPF
jgi:tetratricopeptide (TPR) repeat protein